MTLKQKIDVLLSKLKRVSSLDYVPEVDGLRFLAIVSVILAHTSIFVVNRVNIISANFTCSIHPLWVAFFDNCRRGVQIFFVISGFILALPFAKHYQDERSHKPPLGKFYFQRLTRIEPSYLIALLFFLFSSFLMGRYSLLRLFQSLIKSIAYVNNVITPLSYPLGGVTWSLEIEMQFYLLVPFLVQIFRLKKTLRRSILVCLVVFFAIISYLYPLSFKFIYAYLHFFLSGLLLVDLYLDRTKLCFPKVLSILVGSLLLVSIFFIGEFSLWNKLALVLSIDMFFLMVLSDELWRKIFSIKYLTVIGGMCYSIYLWHLMIIYALGPTIVPEHWSGNYVIFFLFQQIILLVVILLITPAIYLITEKPFMKKDWPRRFWFWLKNKISGMMGLVSVQE